MTEIKKIEIPILGMDCDDCVHHVQSALMQLPGVLGVQVFLAAEKAVIQADFNQVSMLDIRNAVKEVGYQVPETAQGTVQTEPGGGARAAPLNEAAGSVLRLFGLVFGAVLFAVVVGEWMGLFEQITRLIPWYLGLALVLLGGWPVFLNVIRAARRRQVISHTLMTTGVIAAVAVGQWATAIVVVFFMRIGDYTEHFTTERSRRAVKDLTLLAPQVARVEGEGEENEVPVASVQVGDIVVVRPGEQIPVDGEVLTGQATVDQSAITGEGMPVEVGPGSRVFAATFARLGSVRVRTDAVGAASTFGGVVRMVGEAEANRADVQRLADRFSGWFLPVVGAVAGLTFVLRGDPLATAAVLVVACSCSFTLATPIAVLASIGAGARQGLLIKGGKYLELLARADLLLVDKTGTLTLGQPRIVEVIPQVGATADEVLQLAASVERYSEHPLAQAVRSAARERGLTYIKVDDFRALPGMGVSGKINQVEVSVGSRRMIREQVWNARAEELEASGGTLLYVTRAGSAWGVLSAQDALRPEVSSAVREMVSLGFHDIELLTGDNEYSAAAVAGPLQIKYRAGLLPEDKIAIVKAYQAAGRVVVMVGDGINDAPALAQADVGIAMGAAGSPIAIEAAHVALMREDWTLMPAAVKIARRTMRVVRGNLLFTVAYNLLGLSLAAMGILPPVLAAAAQSLPDIGILVNSSRLLNQNSDDR